MAGTHSFDTRNKFTVCIDSYENQIMQGRLYAPSQEMKAFHGLTQLILEVESILDELQTPQAYTIPRRFFPISSSVSMHSTEVFRKGAAATFELQILFRQHTSWQGTLLWKDQKAESSFRSVLELILLMDSALSASSF